MKILVLSDIHCEFHPDYGKEFFEGLLQYRDDYDVAVIAGDLTDFRRMKRSLDFVSDNLKEVVYVLGNHECYKGTLLDAFSQAKAHCAKLGNIHFLENSSVELYGKVFHGCTLWFDYSMGSDMTSEWAMNDFNHIRRFRRDVGLQNMSNRYFLENEVREGDIVVTHHVPSLRSVHPRYMSSPLNKFFVCGMEHVIRRQKPELWIHGHMHDTFDYHIENTWVVCNPYGYMGHQTNPQYQSPLIIEV